MRRRINNLYKGMFKGNKTSNIIELHSKKYHEDNEKENLDLSKKNKEKKRKTSENQNMNKITLENDNVLREELFSDSEHSSQNKSKFKTKLYNKFAKKLGFGTYFKRLRQQVVDKFISGKPLISTDRMYNNPEVKKLFGIIQNENSLNSKQNTVEDERDKRVPPSKFIPYQNNIEENNNLIPLINYNDNNHNFNNNNLENEGEKINNYTLNKINPIYYQNNEIFKENHNNITNNNFSLPFYSLKGIYNFDKRYINNNIDFVDYEQQYLQDMNNFRSKRKSKENYLDNKQYQEKNREKFFVNFNKDIVINNYNNQNKGTLDGENTINNEAEDINNLLNNLKRVNNNKLSNIFTMNTKNRERYCNPFPDNNNMANINNMNNNAVDNNENKYLPFIKKYNQIMDISGNIVEFNTPTKKI